jgi:hypothetical protein
MIADFETRLAEVLGSRMPAPFTGRVHVEPGGPAPSLVVGVRQVDLIEPLIGQGREAVVPGAAEPRRVVHARCHVELRAVPADPGGRAQALEGLDAAIYLLDGADFRGGGALAQAGDPGFVIREMALAPALAATGDGSALAVALDARGLFWPRNALGQAGRAIGSILVRGVLLPVAIEPAVVQPIAGGPDVALAIRVGLPAGTSLPFGAIAVALVAPDGGPGAGSLIGGTEGDPGVRLLALADGTAEVTYRPPAQPSKVDLVVALDHESRLGVVLGRFTLEVRAS